MKDRYLPCYGNTSLRPYLKVPKGRPKSALTGDIRRHMVPSRIFGSREILVYLPPGFSEKDSFSYPLGILQDGQNVFDSATAVFGVEWGVDETAERMIIEQQLRPVILVAVYNSENRILEYTPFPDPANGGGGAEIYRTFITDELLPFLEATYPISHRIEDRAVIGSSLGGLVSLFLGLSQPAIFGAIGCLSPSLWWGQKNFITGLAGAPPLAKRPRLWLDCGTMESDDDSNGNGVPDLVDDMRTLRAVLVYQGYRLDDDLFYHEYEGATHDEQAWSLRIGEVLKTFFPKRDTRWEF